MVDLEAARDKIVSRSATHRRSGTEHWWNGDQEFWRHFSTQVFGGLERDFNFSRTQKETHISQHMHTNHQ
jgi:hypothetical protein